MFLGTTICDYANVYGKDDVVIYVLILSQFDNLWDLNKYIFIIYGWKIYIYKWIFLVNLLVDDYWNCYKRTNCL